MKEIVEVDDLTVEVRFNSRRRTRIAVTIDPAGYVVLDAPLHTQRADVEALVREHARWLRFRVDKVRQETAHRGRVGYAPGEVVLYLGTPLELVQAACPDVRLQGQQLLVPVMGSDDTRDLVRAWYRTQADREFAAILQQFSDLPWLEGRLPVWRHRFMKSQWGSCSSKGVIALNTHLIRVPVNLIEYVVLHELCHLRHHDHSRRFHALMSMHMPDWQDRSGALRRNISLLLDER